ncbi:hypothetical protein C8R45DRAFT_931056 [Mycena sanguinolenta]|nr:hypothetical protein C8R45DRAFT_931056 [Mycena sanguinolenta]
MLSFGLTISKETTNSDSVQTALEKRDKSWKVGTDRTLRVIDPTFAHVAPTGASSYAGTLIDDPHFVKPALGLQHLGFSINGMHHRRQRWPRRHQPLSHRACASGIGLLMDKKPSCADKYCSNVDLSVVSRIGENTTLRTHHDKSSAPGWATPALADEPDAREENVRLPVEEKRGRCGRRVCDGGSHGEAKGNVPSLPGASPSRSSSLSSSTDDARLSGYAASLSPTGLLARHRPDLFPLGTTNGDGLHLATALPSSSRPPVAVGDFTQAQVLRRRRTPAPRRKDQVPRMRGAGGLLLDAFRAQGGKARRGDGGEAMQRVEARDGLFGETGGEVKEEALLSKNLMKQYSDAAAFAGILGSHLTILSTFASDRKEDDGTASTTNSCLSCIMRVSPSTPPRAPSPPQTTRPFRAYGPRGRSSAAYTGGIASRRVARGNGVWAGRGCNSVKSTSSGSREKEKKLMLSMRQPNIVESNWMAVEGAYAGEHKEFPTIPDPNLDTSFAAHRLVLRNHRKNQRTSYFAFISFIIHCLSGRWLAHSVGDERSSLDVK